MKSTNFIPLDIESATIHQISIADNDPAFVMGIQVTHPNLPGKRWFRVNSKDTGYVSRYTKQMSDLRADCYSITAHPKHNIQIIAARFHQIAKQFAIGAIDEMTASQNAQALESITRTSVGVVERYAKGK